MRAYPLGKADPVREYSENILCKAGLSKPGLPPVCLNKVLLAHGHTHLFISMAVTMLLGQN